MRNCRCLVSCEWGWLANSRTEPKENVALQFKISRIQSKASFPKYRQPHRLLGGPVFPRIIEMVELPSNPPILSSLQPRQSLLQPLNLHSVFILLGQHLNRARLFPPSLECIDFGLFFFRIVQILHPFHIFNQIAQFRHF